MFGSVWIFFARNGGAAGDIRIMADDHGDLLVPDLVRDAHMDTDAVSSDQDDDVPGKQQEMGPRAPPLPPPTPRPPANLASLLPTSCELVFGMLRCTWCTPAAAPVGAIRCTACTAAGRRTRTAQPASPWPIGHEE